MDDGLYVPGEPVTVAPVASDDTPAPRRPRVPRVALLAIPVLLVGTAGWWADSPDPASPVPVTSNTPAMTAATTAATTPTTTPAVTVTATVTATATRTLTRTRTIRQTVTTVRTPQPRPALTSTVTRTVTAPPIIITRTVRASRARTCTDTSPTTTLVLAGQEIRADVTGIHCGNIVRAEAASVVSMGLVPVTVRRVEVWRYTRPGSKNAVRSLVVPAQGTGRVRSVILARTLRDWDPGWAGYVRISITCRGETRTVSLHI